MNATSSIECSKRHILTAFKMSYPHAEHCKQMPFVVIRMRHYGSGCACGGGLQDHLVKNCFSFFLN